nr:hypothetical protein [Neobacillus muris]
MELSLLMEYGWVLIILIFLEGLLPADNALVLAIMAKHLPEGQQTKAINMGLLFAFPFRVGAIFIISYLFDVWVGIKLLMHTLALTALHFMPHGFIEGLIWNSVFWTVMLLIAIGGWFLSKNKAGWGGNR